MGFCSCTFDSRIETAKLNNYFMRIIRELSIAKPVDEVWEVLGNQFGKIDNWASIISHSEVSGVSKLPGVDYSIRSTKTTQGDTQQELTGFNPEQHTISYKSISGTPAIIKQVSALWSLKADGEKSTHLLLDFNAEMKGLGFILAPIAKIKLGKVGDVLLDDFKYYVENGKPHPRKIAAS